MGLIIRSRTFKVHMNGRRKNTKTTHLADKTCLFLMGIFSRVSLYILAMPVLNLYDDVHVNSPFNGYAKGR